ncbi:MAG: 1-deoxy-D-xylulose-5-phosphate reductoisomerase [Planctomycetes bacterium]|nr:1-deoxy-D-xylulose-5-phosphate reductoisomerase [Planctomycetota bacterium]
MKNVVILGASGSIGRNALAAIEHLNKNTVYRFNIKALASNSNWQVTLKQIKQFKPPVVIMSDYSAYTKLRKSLPAGRTKILYGNQEIKKAVCAPDVDIVISAISGAEGLYPTLWALQARKTVALANKESLVMAGELLKTLKAFNKIIPVDSEHSGLFQILHNQQTPDHQVKRIILTASGGPFYKLSRKQLGKVTPAQALNHPTYKMGPKITVDSATLMNKALEIIEAHHLFNLPADKISVVIHPQSIIHAMVEFTDGSVIAQMNNPDMKLPIQYALTHPNRVPSQVKPLDFSQAHTFFPPDTKRFPALLLGYEAIRRGGTTGAVLNAANEEAVKLFLQKKAAFTDITKLVSRVLKAYKPLKATLNNIAMADQWARKQLMNITPRLSAGKRQTLGLRGA